MLWFPEMKVARRFLAVARANVRWRKRVHKKTGVRFAKVKRPEIMEKR